MSNKRITRKPSGSSWVETLYNAMRTTLYPHPFVPSELSESSEPTQGAPMSNYAPIPPTPKPKPVPPTPTPEPDLISKLFKPTANQAAGAALLGAVKQMAEGFPARAEAIAFQASILRVKYDSALTQGFTPEQALTLCMQSWGW